VCACNAWEVCQRIRCFAFSHTPLCLTVLVHATLAAVGLSALLRTASALFTVVKLCGAAYLIFLGARALWAARPTQSGVGNAHSMADPAIPPTGAGSPYRQGVLSALLNPKLVVFFATVLPQFIDSRQGVLPHMLLLGVLFDVMVLVWLTSYGLFVTRLRAFFSAARVRRTMERFTGVVLMALGARLALEKS